MLFFLQTILFENVPQSMDISMLVFINVHTHIQIHAYFDTQSSDILSLPSPISFSILF